MLKTNSCADVKFNCKKCSRGEKFFRNIAEGIMFLKVGGLDSAIGCFHEAKKYKC